MATKDCIDQIRAAFKGKRKLSKAEAVFVLDEIDVRAKAASRAGPLTPTDSRWQAIADEVITEVKKAAYIERRNLKINMVVKSKLLALAREAHEKYGDASIGLEAALIGTNKHLRAAASPLSKSKTPCLRGTGTVSCGI